MTDKSRPKSRKRSDATWSTASLTSCWTVRGLLTGAPTEHVEANLPRTWRLAVSGQPAHNRKSFCCVFAQTGNACEGFRFRV
jgi:hypothetical protein